MNAEDACRCYNNSQIQVRSIRYGNRYTAVTDSFAPTERRGYAAVQGARPLWKQITVATEHHRAVQECDLTPVKLAETGDSSTAVDPVASATATNNPRVVVNRSLQSCRDLQMSARHCESARGARTGQSPFSFVG